MHGGRENTALKITGDSMHRRVSGMLEDRSTVQNYFGRLRKYSRPKKKKSHSIKTALNFNTWAGRINCKNTG